MKSFITKLFVALLTFAIGVAVSMSWGFQQAPLSFDHSPTPAAKTVSIREIIPPEIRSADILDLPDSLDPYSIKRYIDEHHSIDAGLLWQKLGIRAEMQTVYSRIGFDPLDIESAIFESCGNSTAEISRLELDGNPGKEVLLKVYQGWGLTRYLIFKSVKVGKSVSWKLLGHADHDFARYYMPHHRVVKMDGKIWLVVTGQGISGTCVSLSYDRWYEVDAEGVREVLSLPAKGHECTTTGYPEREFSSRVLEYRRNKKDERITVLFSIRQGAEMRSGPQINLGTRKQNAVYILRQGAFELEESSSEITLEDIRTAYNVGTFGDEDFLKFNFANLKKIASEGRRAHKEWLREFLEDCSDTPEKKLLQLASKK